jgi:hypothetical protein
MMEKASKNVTMLEEIYEWKTEQCQREAMTDPHISKAYGRLYIIESVSRPRVSWFLLVMNVRCADLIGDILEEHAKKNIPLLQQSHVLGFGVGEIAEAQA